MDASAMEAVRPRRSCRRPFRSCPPARPAASQRGAALIALVLALVLGSGAATVGWLEAAARSTHTALRTEAALAAARDALIGYAASYPDQHSGRHGPGYLPCPDRSGNGSPNTPCRRKSLGRLPWRRLGLHDPRDGAGERLWYALADNFRANGHKHRPMNAATPAELMLDGQDGFAAVLIAPGPPLPHQDRSLDPFDPARFLEGGNENAADAAYVSRGPQPASPGGFLGGRFDERFNDRTAAVSRDELMDAASRRALAAARAVLEDYRDAPWNAGALPWLVPWDRAAEGALPVPGAVAGRLPVSRVGDVLATSFRVTGAPAGGSVSASGTVDAAALRLPPHGAAVPAGRCEWTSAARIDCEGEHRTVPAPGRERVFRFDLHFAGEAVITPPASADVRRRAVRAAEWLEDSHFEVLDLAGGKETGRGRLRFARGPLRGALAVEGVAHPLGAGEEVPEWLLRNEWRRLLMVGSAPAFAPGGGAVCERPGDCLEVVRTTLHGRRDERAAVAALVFAGPALDHQERGAAGGLFAWFEGENANPANLRYEARARSGAFNDRVAAIAPGSGGLAP